jgi:catechol 2,3-dioxygenase-like lactoylglutathione lyase family enzyme
MSNERKARPVGVNHVSIEVESIPLALEFYGRLLDLVIEEADDTMANIAMGDQFIALTAGRHQSPDRVRHFGLVVDDKELFRATLLKERITPLPGRFLGFLDPWGNRVEVIEYTNIMFTKAENVLRGMKMDDLEKNEHARTQLANAGMAK